MWKRVLTSIMVTRTYLLNLNPSFTPLHLHTHPRLFIRTFVPIRIIHYPYSHPTSQRVNVITRLSHMIRSVVG
jgi:hypothetical protein